MLESLHSRGKNGAVSESLARVKCLGYSQCEINFRDWQGSIEMHCIIHPRRKENRKKCRTRALLINIITSDSDGARSKVIHESIVENFLVNWKVTIRKLSSGCSEGNSSVAEETADGLNQH